MGEASLIFILCRRYLVEVVTECNNKKAINFDSIYLGYITLTFISITSSAPAILLHITSTQKHTLVVEGIFKYNLNNLFSIYTSLFLFFLSYKLCLLYSEVAPKKFLLFIGQQLALNYREMMNYM